MSFNYLIEIVIKIFTSTQFLEHFIVDELEAKRNKETILLLLNAKHKSAYSVNYKHIRNKKR